MKVRVVAVTHRQPAWIDTGVAEYAARLPRAWSFEVVELDRRRVASVRITRRAPAGGESAAPAGAGR